MTTPLLLLLDSVLSQDGEQYKMALAQVRSCCRTDVLVDSTNNSLSETVRILVEQNPHFASISSEHDGSLPMHFCASIGDVSVAEILYEKFPQATSIPNDKGKMPLHYAAREGRAAMVMCLLSKSPETASMRSKKDKLSLHFACGEGHLEVVRALLEVDPQGVSIPSAKGKLPLHFAARWGHISVATHLLSLHSQAVEAQDWDGSLPLHDAAREGQVIMSQLLLDRWPQALQQENLRGETPLSLAVRTGNLSLVILLLQAWPQGGKHVLQSIAPNDENVVQNWDWNIIELCLRAADENFHDCPLLQMKHKCRCCHTPGLCDVQQQQQLAEEASSSSFSTSIIQGGNITISPWCGGASAPLRDAAAAPRAVEKCGADAKALVSHASATEAVFQGRSISCCKKRGLSSQSLSKKRLRANSEPSSEREGGDSQCFCPFHPLHAALRNDVHVRILQVVLERTKRQTDEWWNIRDCTGQLPVHVAVAHVKRKESIELCLKEIFCHAHATIQIRDHAHRLPLHVAIEANADFLFIRALVEAFPKSCIQNCQTPGPFVNKPPICMAMTTSDCCDLDTIFYLLRSDPSFLVPHQSKNTTG